MELERVEVETDGHVRLDGHQEFRETDGLGVFFHFFAHGPLQLVGSVQHLLDRAELADELHCCLLAHAGASRHIVSRVAHQGQQVHHLGGGCQPVLVADLLRSEHFGRFAAVTRPVHPHPRRHQLCVVLVGRHHVNLQSRLAALGCQRANHVVGLEARCFEDGDAEGAYEVLDHRDCPADVLGCGFALRFVFGVSLMAEGAARRVEGNAQVVRVVCAQHLLQRIDKAEYSRGVLAFRVDARTAYERVVGAVNQCVGIEQI